MAAAPAAGALRRGFVALAPDAPARAALARLPVPGGARPVHPDDLHLTLCFFGDFGAVPPAAVLQALAPLAAQPPVEVRLQSAEAWSGPRALVAVGPAGAPLAALAAATRDRLAALGLAATGPPFRPHVTLARGLPRAMLPPAAPFDITWRADAVVLFASTEPATLPRYHPLGSVRLRGAPA